MNTDPLFVNVAETDDYRLQDSSPLLDAGNNSLLPADTGDLDWDGNTVEVLPKDLALGNRIKSGVLSMGAYEKAAGAQ